MGREVVVVGEEDENRWIDESSLRLSEGWFCFLFLCLPIVDLFVQFIGEYYFLIYYDIFIITANYFNLAIVQMLFLYVNYDGWYGAC